MTPRTLVWFSCGVTSAIAAKIVADTEENVEICYCAGTLSTEHPDNERFLRDCEEWIGLPVKRLYSDKYSDIWDVFQKTRWLVGPQGARCTTELKKLVRRRYTRPDDRQVFGFDFGEEERAKRFKDNNVEVLAEFPLIDLQVTKAQCLEILREEGIEIPALYRMGYKNNNCIGCVKGQQGYWNKIRVDFPEVFDRMALLERELGVAINKTYAGGEGRKKVFLDELDMFAGRYSQEPSVQCGVACDAEEVSR